MAAIVCGQRALHGPCLIAAKPVLIEARQARIARGSCASSDPARQRERRAWRRAGGQLVEQGLLLAARQPGVQGLGFERHRNRTTIATAPLPGHRELAAAPRPHRPRRSAPLAHR